MLSADILEHYDRWLVSTPLAARNRSNYRRWVPELVEDLIAGDELAAFLPPGGANDRRAILTDCAGASSTAASRRRRSTSRSSFATPLLDARAPRAPRYHLDWPYRRIYPR